MQSPAPPAPSSSPLRNPIFRRLWVGNMASNLGMTFQAVGAAWIMMTMTGSAQMTALVQSAVSLPMLLLSLFAGTLADTFDRRRIMLVAHLHMVVMTALLTVTVTTGTVTPSLLLAFVFLIGCGAAMHLSSWQVSLRDIVGRQNVSAAVAFHSMGFNLMRSAGPAVGGAVLAAAGAAPLFALNALCYLVLAVLLVFWRRPPSTASVREPLVSALVAGLRYSAMSPPLVRVVSRGALFCTLAVSLVSLLPVVASQTLGGGAVLYGALLGSFGLGAVAAAAISPQVRERFTTEQIVGLNFAIFGLALISVAVSGSAVITFAATFAAGCCWVLTNSTLNVTIQLSAATWVVGRSISILHTGLFGGITIGSWAWGAVAENFGVRTALAVSGVSLLAGAPIGRIVPLPRPPEQSLEPADRFREPEVSVDLQRHPGPIHVAIQYLIPKEHEAEFLEVMVHRRQVRRRDGALRWALRRDLASPQRWTEQYQVPTWADYVRHNQRRTEADAGISDKLWSLHRGPEPPVVRRSVDWDPGG